jgi:hypothetical protein
MQTNFSEKLQGVQSWDLYSTGLSLLKIFWCFDTDLFKIKVLAFS